VDPENHQVLEETNLPTPIYQGPTVNLLEDIPWPPLDRTRCTPPCRPGSAGAVCPSWAKMRSSWSVADLADITMEI